MKDKIIKVLSIAGGIFGAVAAFDVIPLVSTEVSIAIIGLSASLSSLITKVEDFVDDGKLNGSNK